MNTFPLEQKVCMITGGLGGFSLAISELMIKRGAKVWLCDLKQEEEGLLSLQNNFSEALEKNNIGYCRCDVTSENEFNAAFVKCNDKMGEKPDVLINAAGILGEEQWENLYDINLVRLKTTKYCIRKFHSENMIIKRMLNKLSNLLERYSSRDRTCL